MRLSLLIIFCISISPCFSQQGEAQQISPSSKFIRITGRVKNDRDSVTFYWSGTSVLTRFSGSELKARLKDERGENYFNIIIDGRFSHYIKLSPVKQFYTLAKNLGKGEHTVELVKRNEWDTGRTWFYGIEVTGNMLSLPPANKRVIEFFGNSITAGYAIDDSTGSDSPKGPNTNNYPTYAALTARHFNADGYYTVKSGIGIMVSWFPLVMPQLYNRLDPNDSLSVWDFKKVVPDVVVINLFQNDSWLVEKPEHPSFKTLLKNKKPTEQEIVAAYQSFVKKIRKAYPKASIICALGSMDATREGSPWPGYVEKAVNGLHDTKVYTHFFPFTQKPGHPGVDDNKKMAEGLIGFIEKNIKW